VLEGYVVDTGEDGVRLWRRGSTETTRVPAARVRRVALSGRDPVARGHAVWRERRHAEAAPPSA
jgi:hypothetical protein